MTIWFFTEDRICFLESLLHVLLVHLLAYDHLDPIIMVIQILIFYSVEINLPSFQFDIPFLLLDFIFLFLFLLSFYLILLSYLILIFQLFKNTSSFPSFSFSYSFLSSFSDFLSLFCIQSRDSFFVWFIPFLIHSYFSSFIRWSIDQLVF